MAIDLSRIRRDVNPSSQNHARRRRNNQRPRRRRRFCHVINNHNFFFLSFLVLISSRVHQQYQQYLPLIFVFVHSFTTSSTTTAASTRSKQLPSSSLSSSPLPTISLTDTSAPVPPSETESTETTASTQINSSPTSSQYVMLLSLKWPSSTSYSKHVADVWKWKDMFLGDGRDFFEGRPKTLMKLSHYILENVNNNNNNSSSSSSSTRIQECSILSNCARFEIMLRLCAPHDEKIDHSFQHQQEQQMIINGVSRCLSTQVRFGLYGDQQNTATGGMLSSISSTISKMNRNRFDRPEDVLTPRSPSCHSDENVLSDYWTARTGCFDVLDYLSRISAGIARRPKRPDRDVPFRPFSSRDQHILLQLKRTSEVAVGVGVSVEDSTVVAPSEIESGDDGDDSDADADGQRSQGHRQRSYLPLLLEYSLRAGKAARNPDIVSSLSWMRDTYGTGDSSRTSSEVPIDVSNRIANEAYEQAILPLVNEGTTKLEYLLLEEEQQHRSKSSHVFKEGGINTDNPVSKIVWLRQKMNEWADDEILGTMTTTSNVDQSEEEELRLSVRQLVNRKLHLPTMELRTNNGKFQSHESMEDCLLCLKDEIRNEIQILTSIEKN